MNVFLFILLSVYGHVFIFFCISFHTYDFILIIIRACCKEGFTASPGWDPASGIGSLDYAKMSRYFMNLVNGLSTVYMVTQTICGINKTQVIMPKFTQIYIHTIGSLLNINSSHIDILSTNVVNVPDTNINSYGGLRFRPIFDLRNENRHFISTQCSSIAFKITVSLTNSTSVMSRLTKGMKTLSSALQSNGYPQAQAYVPVIGTFSPTPSPTNQPIVPNSTGSASNSRAAVVNSFIALIGLLSMVLSF